MSNIPSQLKTTWRLRFSVIKLEIRKPSAYGGDDIQSGSVANQQFRIFTTRIRSDRNIRIFINAFRTSLVFCLCLSKAYTRAPVASSSTVDNFSRCEKKKPIRARIETFMRCLLVAFIYFRWFFFIIRTFSFNKPLLWLNLLERDIIGVVHEKKESLTVV